MHGQQNIKKNINVIFVFMHMSTYIVQGKRSHNSVYISLDWTNIDWIILIISSP